MTQIGQSTFSSGAEPGIAEIIDRLSGFDGPPQQFLSHLLAAQCQLARAEAGAVLRVNEQGRAEVLAVHPQIIGDKAPAWLAGAFEAFAQVQTSGRTLTRPLTDAGALYGQPSRRYLVLLPLKGQGGVRGVTAFAVESDTAAGLTARQERLELTASLLSLYEMRLTLQARQSDLRRLRTAMETLTSINEPRRFRAVAMALCNEAAAHWQCERVCLGILKGRYVHAAAMSHTEKFSRKMKIVQDVESAMEECLDQDVEIIYPAAADATYVSRAAGQLSARHGPTAVLSMPLRQAGEVVAVLTLERAADRPFAAEEIESLRLTCDLTTARLLSLHEHDRWFGARMFSSTRRGVAALAKPKHTMVKVVAVALVAVLLGLFFIEGRYQAEAPFMLDAIERQGIPAPFDGVLESAAVFPGDAVTAGETIMATMETAELRLRLSAMRAEHASYLKEAATALRDNKQSDAQIARQRALQVEAQMNLLNYHISQSRIMSPLTGIVIAGDWQRHNRPPVKTGDILFEVAPLEGMRAELAVPEDQIAELCEGQQGELATASYPDRRIRFEVERIQPLAEVVDQRNIFKVRVRLLDSMPWMRPGMEGVAKVDLGRRSYGWLWTRRMVNWVRMKFWI